MLRRFQLHLGNSVAIFFGKNCQVCLLSVHFVVAKLYLFFFPFSVDVDLIVSVPEFTYLLS